MSEAQELTPQQQQLREVLRTQSHDVSSLAGELASSYEKEIGFLSGLMSRDQEIKKLKAKNKAYRQKHDPQQKKIWWLESELNRHKDALAAEREKNEYLTKRLAALQASPLGKAQRAYWSLRSKVR
ncbi:MULTISPECIES: hypothetical protein [Kocuria]|uniref:Uncharacterized protein n=1 Tax=Kocuria subflava TaxID=1736139 RepID=A0A846TKN1_9MICC|nr:MULTISPECIES: hypothetical protein [Kocuria]NKE09768.1 hypothetical protein [Kocuria subflava]